MSNEEIFNELREEIRKTPFIIDTVHRGTSIEDAIIIQGTLNTKIGVIFEHFYIDEIFSDSNFKNQTLVEKDGKYYDVMEVENHGNKYRIYFDITEFYGKVL